MYAKEIHSHRMKALRKLVLACTEVIHDLSRHAEDAVIYPETQMRGSFDIRDPEFIEREVGQFYAGDNSPSNLEASLRLGNIHCIDAAGSQRGAGSPIEPHCTEASRRHYRRPGTR